MNELKLLENELVPVYVTSTGEKVVYGTELYDNLGSKRQYTDWIKGRFVECDAAENVDYQSFSQNCEKPSGGRPKQEYIIKLDTAKEMAMLERNEQGKRVRRYFIRVEAKYNEEKEKKKIEKSSVKKTPLSSVNMMVKNVQSSLEKAGVDKIFIAAEIKRIYTDAGYEVKAPLLTDKEAMPKLYDCTEMARELGIMSKTGNPHCLAVSAIIKQMDIEENEIVTTAFTRNGHDDVTTQYTPSVLNKVKGWLEVNNYPVKIIYENSKGSLKTCMVVYQFEFDQG
ncbi:MULTISPECIES: antA/AntB antirepressor family protein [Eisenbergiella]|uniref:AntA/AntB antirepressor domain-containing protein n=1 Tax=Eisenbergiella porci TaxID=2652274 RepID=A0A6N7WJK0_9FIRM|nr:MULTISPECIES: antA/AntB antirepressor family protein [Eisenbergiella]MDY2652131.1 antA/AntB antirepressor family protein [Eisenbergiella porci]MSS90893.1 hypothetical protein [Eisenbergiella porci]